MKGYDKKSVKPAPAEGTHANLAYDKAAIKVLTQKIAEKLASDPRGAEKAGKIISEWLNRVSAKKSLRKVS